MLRSPSLEGQLDSDLGQADLVERAVVMDLDHVGLAATDLEVGMGDRW